MMGPWFGAGYPGFGWVMMLYGLVPLLLLVGLALLVWGALGRRNANPALQELQLRYVRGEIDKAQYEALRRDLK